MINYRHYNRFTNTRPLFRLDLVRLQWRYLRDHPQKIDKKLFSEMLSKGVINQNEYQLFLFAFNHNLACQFAIDIEPTPKYGHYYCSHCPYVLRKGEIIDECHISYFKEYDKLIDQLLFNEDRLELLTYYTYTDKIPYIEEINRITDEIKKLITNKILNMDIRFTYFDSYWLYGIKTSNI